MHKGRAVCRAMGGVMFCRPAAVIELIDRKRAARAFLAATAARDHATSAIDKIPNRKIDRLAQTSGMLFLAA